MSDTILRQLEMLKLLPHWPHKVDSTTLQKELGSLGFQVSQRTIQRDLQKLSGLFPLLSDDTPGRYGWSWKRDSLPISIVSMPSHVAVTFKMVEKLLLTLLPLASVDHLQGYFKSADYTLDALSNKAFVKWSEKVIVSQRTHAMLPPYLTDEVIVPVYQALFEEKKIEIVYQTPLESTKKSAVVNPLGLLVREPVIYLVCTFWNYEDIRQIPLHRIDTAQMLSDPAIFPEEFSLSRFIDGYDQDILLNDEIYLEAKISRLQALYLEETPISSSQSLELYDSGDYLLSARIKDTVQFRRWVLSLTGEIEVLKPESLRDQIASAIDYQLKIYNA